MPVVLLLLLIDPSHSKLDQTHISKLALLCFRIIGYCRMALMKCRAVSVLSESCRWLRRFRSDAALEAIAKASEGKVANLVLYNYPSFSGAYSALFAHLFHSHIGAPRLILPFSRVEPFRSGRFCLENLEAVNMQRKNLKMCLRSTDRNTDISEVAKAHGGGGSLSSSSFIVRMDESNQWTSVNHSSKSQGLRP